jgi:hypothetical protein
MLTWLVRLDINCALLRQVVLYIRWPTQLSLRLSGVLLLALLEPGLLFAEDITVVRPGGEFDAEHVARCVRKHASILLAGQLPALQLAVQQLVISG